MSESCSSYQECCLYFTANTLSRQINQLAEEAFSTTGLAPAYAYLLMLIVEKPGQNQNELSAGMHLKASTMTRFIEKLEHLGYVTKVVSGRSVAIFPTEAGEAFPPRFNAALELLYKHYCELLGEQFANRLTADINLAIKSLDK